MPRRHALTEAQLEILLAFPAAEPDLIGVAALLRLVLARLGPAHQASEDRQ